MQAKSNTREFSGKSQTSALRERSGSNALPWPGEKKTRQRVIPVFLPFSGCKTRCIFCAQEAQTGTARPGDADDVAKILGLAESEVERASRKNGPLPQLAFYGGTFTAQPRQSLALCLELAEKLRASGKIASFRCSTRPDCLDQSIIARLRASGCEMIELGVQSFDDRALGAAHRGYSGADATEGAILVKMGGISLGIQLLPGLPTQKAEIFLDDVARAIALGADCLRFYPCQVPEGTALARMWREGKYRPWPLALAARMLARGLLMANMAKVPVIRIGLAPQDGFNILSGPSHPDLGGIVRGRALVLGALRLAKKTQRSARPLENCRLLLPKSAQGYALGHKKSLLPVWKRLGLQEIIRTDLDEISLERMKEDMRND